LLLLLFLHMMLLNQRLRHLLLHNLTPWWVLLWLGPFPSCHASLINFLSLLLLLLLLLSLLCLSRYYMLGSFCHHLSSSSSSRFCLAAHLRLLGCWWLNGQLSLSRLASRMLLLLLLSLGLLLPRLHSHTAGGGGPNCSQLSLRPLLSIQSYSQCSVMPEAWPCARVPQSMSLPAWLLQVLLAGVISLCGNCLLRTRLGARCGGLLNVGLHSKSRPTAERHVVALVACAEQRVLSWQLNYQASSP
jgi:hypothetical protein